MSKPAAIAGSLVDAKNVNTHKCVRLSIDVPAELAAQVFAAFGWPTMADPVPVAIARLVDPKAATGQPEPKEGRKKWDELPPAQQAAIRCGEPEFRRFLVETGLAHDNEDPAETIRRTCDVESRAELNRSHEARGVWHQIEDDFFLWQRGIQ
jgi:hypothetical protein